MSVRPARHDHPPTNLLSGLQEQELIQQPAQLAHAKEVPQQFPTQLKPIRKKVGTKLATVADTVDDLGLAGSLLSPKCRSEHDLWLHNRIDAP